MKKHLLSLILLFVFGFVHADERRNPLYIVIDVSKYSSSPLIIKKALIKSVIDNNWKISKHTKKIILAKHKDETIEISINNSIVTVTEVMGKYFDDEDDNNDSKIFFIKKWFKSLEYHFKKNVYYQYHLRLADKLDK